MAERLKGRSEWQALGKGGEIVELESRRYVEEPDTELWTPATPARITPSRRKIPERDYDSILVFGDNQIDYRRIIDSQTGDQELVETHDERMIRIGHMMARHTLPKLIVNLGDTVDYASLSRFDPDSDHFHKTLGLSHQRAHDMYAQYRADSPEATIVELDSNHNARLAKYVLTHMPQLYDIHRPGAEEDEHPVLTYPYLANLESVGVDFISGYGEAEYVYGEEYDGPPIVFKHGMTTSPSSTSAKEAKNYPSAHIIRGHAHRSDRVYTTLRHGPHRGHYLTSAVVGTSARITGEVPAVHSAVNDHNRPVESVQAWQQSLMVIRDYRNGRYEFVDVPVQDGVGYFEGRMFDGNED